MAHGYDLYAGDEEEGFALLRAAEHGHLTAWDGEGRPLLTFLHYVLQPETREVWGHLANTNPLLARLERDPRAVFTVAGPSVYVPSYYSGEPRGVPTSYYSWAQCEVTVHLEREPDGLLAILEAMLARFQPEGGQAAIDPADRYWQGLLGAITGVRMRVESVASRFKYGQNKRARTRETIVERLRGRGGLHDEAAAAQVLAHLPPGADAAKGD